MINIAEILKNAPQGLKLYSLTHGEVTLEKVDINIPDYPIIVIDRDEDDITFTKDGKLINNIEDAECILFPSKEHKSWDNWQEVLFQIGDIVTNNITHRSFIITNYNTHELIDRQGSTYHNKFVDYEYATPEEREQFFKELNANGYTWNDNTKQMEKSLQQDKHKDCLGCVFTETKEESFTINLLKPFDKVLMRNEGEWWRIEIFQSYFKGFGDYIVYAGITHQKHQCIPYNDETKHLIGTTDDCPDKYKTW